MAKTSHQRLENIPIKIRTANSDRVMFGDVVYAPGGTCGPRVQSDYQLVVLVAGGASVVVDAQQRSLAAGQVGLFLPGKREHFTFAAGHKSHHTWCAIHPGLVPAEMAEACRRAAVVLPVSRRLEQLIELGLSLPLTAGTQAHGLIDALGLAVLQAYLFTDTRQERGATDKPDALRRALAWIGTAGHEAVDLPALARAAGVSPAHLVKLFKRHLGTTPLRYVWETRTRRGVQLLRETGLTVGEVAHRCGFQTPFHFSRWCKQLHGVAPRDLRAQAWGR
jgi:AraC family transcriptional regulator of arabinose operon